MNILKIQSFKNDLKSLNTCGFLHYHGIELEKSNNLAKKYFKKSASLKDQDGIYACFLLSNQL